MPRGVRSTDTPGEVTLTTAELNRIIAEKVAEKVAAAQAQILASLTSRDSPVTAEPFQNPTKGVLTAGALGVPQVRRSTSVVGPQGIEP